VDLQAGARRQPEERKPAFSLLLSKAVTNHVLDPSRRAAMNQAKEARRVAKYWMEDK